MVRALGPETDNRWAAYGPHIAQQARRDEFKQELAKVNINADNYAFLKGIPPASIELGLAALNGDPSALIAIQNNANNQDPNSPQVQFRNLIEDAMQRKKQASLRSAPAPQGPLQVDGIP